MVKGAQNQPGLPSGLGPGGGSGSGGGGGDDPPYDEPQESSIVIPCPSDSETCELVDSVKFIAQLRQTVTAAEGNNYEKVNDWLNDVTGRKIVVIELPDLLVTREAAIKEIFRLEVQVDNAVTTRLRADVERLLPLQWDSPQVEHEKMKVVMDDDRQRVQTWKEAAEQSQPSKSMTTVSLSERTESSSHDSHSRVKLDNYSYRQLIQADLTKSFGSH